MSWWPDLRDRLEGDGLLKLVRHGLLVLKTDDYCSDQLAYVESSGRLLGDQVELLFGVWLLVGLPKILVPVAEQLLPLFHFSLFCFFFHKSIDWQGS